MFREPIDLYQVETRLIGRQTYAGSERKRSAMS